MISKNPFFRLLKSKNFLKLWGSQLFSQLTLNLINFIIILKIFEATQSTVAISLVWIFYILPALLLGPFAGTVVDLIDRRKILLWSTLIEAAVVLLYLLVKTKIWPIYGVVFLFSLIYQFYIPAEAATLPRVVPRSLLPPANTIFLFTIYGAVIVGFSLAGSIVRLIGGETPFIIASIFLLTASFLIFFLPKFALKKKNKIRDPQEFWQRFKDGYVFIRQQPVVLFPLLLLVLTQVIINPLILLAPSYVTQILGVDLLDAGLVFAFPFGIGAVLGAQGVVWALKRARKKRVINFSLFFAFICLFILGAVVPFLSLSVRLMIVLITVLVLGISYVGLIVPAQTIIQEQTPEDLRGRVFGALFFTTNLALVGSIFLNATLTDLLGVVLTIVAVSVVVGIVWVFSLKELYYYGVFVKKEK